MIIKLSVKPGSKENRIEKTGEEEYKIYTKERAENGKANISIIKMLSKYFNTDYRKIEIKNPLSRKKIVEIN